MMPCTRVMRFGIHTHFATVTQMNANTIAETTLSHTVSQKKAGTDMHIMLKEKNDQGSMRTWPFPHRRIDAQMAGDLPDK